MRRQNVVKKIRYADCPIMQYYSAILKRKIVVSRKVRIVYQYLYRLVRKQGRFYYDPMAANIAIDFIEKFCRQSKDPFAGQPIKLLLYQKAMLSAIFGIIDKYTGQRKFKEFLLMIARKNGKSTLCSAIAAYMLFADGEGGAEIYSAATKQDQAKIVWEETKKMILKSPALNDIAKCQRDDIRYGDSIFKPLGRDSKSFDGFNASCVIVDEIHAITDDELYGLLKQAQSSRTKPLMCLITTAGFVRAHLFDTKYEEAEAIIRDIELGEDPGSTLPIVYELDDYKKEALDEGAWIKANPALGIIKSYDYLRDQVRAAQRTNRWNDVYTKDFNVPRNGESLFFELSELINKEMFDEHEMFDGQYAILGMDLSKTYDLTAACMIVKRAGQWYVKTMAWMPERIYEQRLTEETKTPWKIWHDAGLFRLSAGSKVNYHDVFNWIQEIADEFNVSVYKLGYDAWGTQFFAEELENYLGRGVLQPIYQGYKTLSLPMQNLKADFADKKIIYNNNPLLQWCCLNVKCVEDRNGNMMPDKSAKRLKIDCFAALLDAYAAYSMIQEEFDSLEEA